ncbi:hypothetical protein HPP92_017283 [Vanilla planifolia]|uniref:Uncharacterized protein n=1 Tax=Vanilla planifolia TaxID=51239 RepID=A0A835QL04_VANPL|nr:hypothetical protein HPP92_017283 [Vanilla planifolia]
MKTKRIDGEIGKSGSESIAPVDKIRINSSACEKNAEDEVTKVEASEANQKPQSGTETGIEVVEGKVEDASTSTIADKISCPENADTSSKALAGPSSSQHDVTNGAEPLRRKSSLETHSMDMVSTFPQEAEACPKMSAADGERKDELASSTEVSTAEQDAVAKLDFDLNEGIIGEDVNQNEPVPTVLPVSSPSVRMSNLSSLVTSPTLAGAPAFITVAAPAKGPFRPPENLLKSKGELGWKGSAATSAFRPAEPRKVLEMTLNSSDVMSSDNAVPKQGRPPLEIDLNVPDDRAVEDMASQSSAQTTGSESGVISNHDAPLRSAGGLDLDLNLVDEGAENGQFFANSCRRLEVPVVPTRSAAEGFQNGEVNILRDFDLNNGPSIDDVVVEPVPRSQNTKICANIRFFAH